MLSLKGKILCHTAENRMALHRRIRQIVLALTVCYYFMLNGLSNLSNTYNQYLSFVFKKYVIINLHSVMDLFPVDVWQLNLYSK